MGFWTNWKDKRKEKKPEPNQETKKMTEKEETPKAKEKSSTLASALEENENQKYHQQIVDDIDNEIEKTQQQKIDDLIADPHLHSQGFIAPKQGVQVFVEDVVDNSNLEVEKKKKNQPKPKTKPNKKNSKENKKPLVKKPN